MNWFTDAQAVAMVSGNGVAGKVWFSRLENGILVTAEVSGLPREGFFAFHIHEGTGCGGEDFGNTGGHFNPGGTAHPDHAGDLPPLLSCKGRAYLSVLTDRFDLEQIMGRTVVIHSGTDDFRSQPAGDPGAKLACGVIGYNW